MPLDTIVQLNLFYFQAALKKYLANPTLIKAESSVRAFSVHGLGVVLSVKHALSSRVKVNPNREGVTYAVVAHMLRWQCAPVAWCVSMAGCCRWLSRHAIPFLVPEVENYFVSP